MKTRFAFAGFRHAHILDLLTGIEERPDTGLAACCEEDAATREALAASGRVRITHTDFSTMLREVECEVIAIVSSVDEDSRRDVQEWEDLEEQRCHVTYLEEPFLLLERNETTQSSSLATRAMASGCRPLPTPRDTGPRLSQSVQPSRPVLPVRLV